MELNAKNFFECYVNAVTDPATGNYKRYHGNGNFTKEIVREAVQDLISQMTYFGDPCQFAAEYYRIDYIAWRGDSQSESAATERYGLKPYKWDLLAAIEHENAHSMWNDEVVKLAPIRCPLRVVIGYCRPKERASQDRSDMEKLSYVASVLNTMKASFVPPCDGEEFMVILGNTGNRKANYKGYLYQPESHCFELKFEML